MKILPSLLLVLSVNSVTAFAQNECSVYLMPPVTNKADKQHFVEKMKMKLTQKLESKSYKVVDDKSEAKFLVSKYGAVYVHKVHGGIVGGAAWVELLDRNTNEKTRYFKERDIDILAQSKTLADLSRMSAFKKVLNMLPSCGQ